MASHATGSDTSRNLETPPPPYTLVAGAPPPPGPPRQLSEQELNGLNAAFASLTLPPVATELDEQLCLAHLKLLSAFHLLKEDVGYTDGLWGIYDTRAGPVTKKGADPGPELAKLREKRWAIYVARAVDRYTAWWSSLESDPLTIKQCKVFSSHYSRFTDAENPYEHDDIVKSSHKWTPQTLPPLDVLMVWHAHMLNPRDYLEDCIRTGRRELWAAGMPWNLVNRAIDASFAYRVPNNCPAVWKAATGREWSNAQDSLKKDLKCPTCANPSSIPWTTCSFPENSNGQAPDLVGNGYGDGDFRFRCTKCKTLINRELLEVTKFIDDVKGLLTKERPMPGTILASRTGLPEGSPAISPGEFLDIPMSFPNRLIQRHLKSELQELMQPGQRLRPVNMESIRTMIEDAIEDKEVIKKVEGLKVVSSTLQLLRDSRIATRKMMSRYWGNSTPFALELGGAVLRQGIFTEKMHQIDWIHSPAAQNTMKRLVVKYERFIQIMINHPGQVAVPTLDVDLAWHTHQLSPRTYLDFTLARAGLEKFSVQTRYRKLIDHDDKINEDKLSSAFEWTSKTYQEIFGEVYSECTCWYCEAVRCSHVNSVGKALGVSKNEKIANDFHDSGKAKLCPPDSSAHISAHNAVKFHSEDRKQAATYKAMHDAQVARMDTNYQRAVRRTGRKDRQLPPRDQYYYYWGYPYMAYGPWVCPVYWEPGYYGSDPGSAVAGTGSAGACATGTCGGGAGAGACGGAGAGGCGASGACGSAGACAGGGSSFGGCGGGSSGGGGGGCGGGGGGGCGGGGGGGGCGGGGC